MADLKMAVDFVIEQEDRGLTGVVTHTEGDPGGATRFGICERWHPDLIKARYFDGAAPIPIMSNAAAHAVAVQIYTAEYAEPLCLGEIVDQDIANRLLSFAVNEGPEQAIKIFQRALSAVTPGFNKRGAVDGHIGIWTLAWLNKAPSVELRQQVSSDESDYYRTWAAQKPNRARLLNGLLARAQA